MIANRPAAGPSPTPPGPQPVSSRTPEPRPAPPESEQPPTLGLFDRPGDEAWAQTWSGPASIVIPESAPTPTGRPFTRRLAELVDWRDLLGPTGDTRPLLRRPRVMVLLCAVIFALSPLVASVVGRSDGADPMFGPTSIPTSAGSSTTAPLPTLGPTGTP